MQDTIQFSTIDDPIKWCDGNASVGQIPFVVCDQDWCDVTNVNDYIGLFREDAGVVLGPINSPPVSQSVRWWLRR